MSKHRLDIGWFSFRKMDTESTHQLIKVYLNLNDHRVTYHHQLIDVSSDLGH